MSAQFSGTNFYRLRAAAAQARLQAIQSQLAVGFTLCEIAETEIIYGRLDVARKLIEKLLHSGETIDCHLAEPRHVPDNSVADLRDQLTQLKKRICKVEMQLRDARR